MFKLQGIIENILLEFSISPSWTAEGPLFQLAQVHSVHLLILTSLVAPANLGIKYSFTFSWSWCNQGYFFFFSLTCSRSAVDSHSVISQNSHHLSCFLSGGLFSTAVNLKITKGIFTPCEFLTMESPLCNCLLWNLLPFFCSTIQVTAIQKDLTASYILSNYFQKDHACSLKKILDLLSLQIHTLVTEDWRECSIAIEGTNRTFIQHQDVAVCKHSCMSVGFILQCCFPVQHTLYVKSKTYLNQYSIQTWFE